MRNPLVIYILLALLLVVVLFAIAWTLGVLPFFSPAVVPEEPVTWKEF